MYKFAAQTSRLTTLFLITLLTINSSQATPSNSRHHQHHKIRIYGHRGARALAPENTLAAYQIALNAKVDTVDMDINMSKDGVLMVTHDSTLNPAITRDKDNRWLTNTNLRIKDLTAKQIQQYNVGRINVISRYAKYFSKQHFQSFEMIPTLEQVIHFVKIHQHQPTHFQIEIKSSATQPELTYPPMSLARALVTILNKEKISAITEVQSFDYRCLQAIHRIAPNIKTAYLTSHKELILNKNKLLQWHAGFDINNYHSSYPEMVAAIGGALWEPEDTVLTKAELDHAHQLGLQVVVWSDPTDSGHGITVDEFMRLKRWGVDGVIVDDPTLLLGVR